jgi:lysosomal acid lipase/cholesteryl ester hydrolase
MSSPALNHGDHFDSGATSPVSPLSAAASSGDGHGSGSRGHPVLLWHGLLNTSLPFVMNGAGRALGFVLADAGYDVWMANTRGNMHSRRHTRLVPSDVRFWDWSIDDLTLDVEACINYVLRVSRASSCSYIGHSQGAVIGLQALATLPHLAHKVRLYVGLSAAPYIDSGAIAASPWLRRMCSLVSNSITARSSTPNTTATTSAAPSSSKSSGDSSGAFWRLAGRGAFMDVMEVGRHVIPPLLWSHLGECMFAHLFEWTTVNWDRVQQPLYFQEVPSITSSRCIAHWLQRVASGRFTYYDYSSDAHYGHGRDRHYGDALPEYPLEAIRTPCALFIGARDRLPDVRSMVRGLGARAVYVKTLTNNFHMDDICGRNSVHDIYPDILLLLAGRLPTS